MLARMSSADLVQRNGLGSALCWSMKAVIASCREARLRWTPRRSWRSVSAAKKSGSAESLKVSTRCGCRPNAHQIRCTVPTGRLLALAIGPWPDPPERRAAQLPRPREFQCMPSGNRLSGVRLVAQALQPIRGKAVTPFPHRVGMRAQVLCDQPRAARAGTGRHESAPAAPTPAPSAVAPPRLRAPPRSTPAPATVGCPSCAPRSRLEECTRAAAAKIA